MTARWFAVRRGARVGLATSLPVAAGVLLIWLMPTLLLGYPLVLLPLLLTGPLAVVGLSWRRALSAAFVAGVVSSVLTVTSLAIGYRVLGTWVWSLVTQASMPPMPEWTPHLTPLPTTVLTWAQQ